jgi:hypothetical protein
MTDQSNSDSRRRRIAIKEADLDELYLLVQGAPYANTLLDAKMTLSHHDLAKTLQLVQSGRSRYRQSHWRTLRRDGDETLADEQGSKEGARLRQQLVRCQLVLEAFDDVIAILERMIKLRAGKAPASARPKGSAAAFAVAASILTDQFRVEYETAHTLRAQILAIRRHFAVRRVETEADIERDQLYYLHGKEQTYLIVVPGGELSEEQIPITLALSGQVMQPIARRKFLEMGAKLRLVRLVPKTAEDVATTDEIGDAWAQSEEQGHSVVEAPEQGLIDKGTFSQLHDAAQRSGLVPNADVIAYTRDREFRLKDYQKAFQAIEGLYGKFCTAATQRDQRLRREDLDIAAGRIQISPKQLMEKRARDIAENQLVDRARSRFLRVLEGLRVMTRQSTSRS